MSKKRLGKSKQSEPEQHSKESIREELLQEFDVEEEFVDLLEKIMVEHEETFKRLSNM